MATLIQVFVDARRVGWCDEKCYDSQAATCSCCCGGRNHGVGHRQARAITKTIPLAQIAAWADSHFTVTHTLAIRIHVGRARLMPCADHESGPHGLQEPV